VKGSQKKTDTPTHYCEMGKKEQVPALAIFVQGSLWSETSRGRPPDGGLALAVFHILVPRGSLLLLISSYILLLISLLRNVLLPPSSRPARLLRLTVVSLPCVVW